MSHYSKNRRLTMDAVDMDPSCFNKCGCSLLTHDANDLPPAVPKPSKVQPPMAGPSTLSAEELAGVKQLVKLLPALNQLLNTGTPPEEEQDELPSDGNDLDPTQHPEGSNGPDDEKRTLDGGWRPIGWDIYTTKEPRRATPEPTLDEAEQHVAPALGFDIYTDQSAAHATRGNAALKLAGQGLVYR